MRFVTLFPGLMNFHLVKEVCMIPYSLQMQCGYDVAVATFRNGEYPYLENETSGLELEFIDSITGINLLDVCLYLVKNSKKIDILNIYHGTRKSAIYAILYKIFNKHGKIYLKMDADCLTTQSIKLAIRIRRLWLMPLLFGKCDLITIESTKSLDFMIKAWKKWEYKMRYLPSGVLKKPGFDNSTNHRSDIICTVGRLGTYQKNTEMLLEAFRQISDKRPQWILKLAGSIEEEFKPSIKQFFSDNNHLTNRVCFVGEITDRDKLRDFYLSSKIFAFPSRYESFGLVLAEACSFGLFPLTSNFSAAYDITDNGRFGRLFETDGLDGFVSLLLEVTEPGFYNDELPKDVSEYIDKNFNWFYIAEKLHEYIKELY